MLTNKKKKGAKNIAIKQMFRKAIKSAKEIITKKKPKHVNDAAKLAITAAKSAIKKHPKISLKAIQDGLPRIIPVPKIGGILPLIPIFAGLSALGALVGGSASVANAVVSANNAKRNFKEAQRHNETLEAIALGKRSKAKSKSGNGLYLKPYKTGLGLYLNHPHPHQDFDNNSKNISTSSSIT